MSKSALESRFLFMWKALGGPKLLQEVKFHPVRKWRFDFLHIESRTVIELEGGIWVKGAHSRGSHFNSDCEKYNSATLMGFKIYRLTTNMIHTQNLEPIIKSAQMSAI